MRQVLPSPETSIRYDRPYAASQSSTTRPTGCAEPRSTRSDWLSDEELDQRVPGLPSTARAAGYISWLLVAVTGRPAARFGVAVPRRAGKETTCWYVGRFCQAITGWVIPPSGDWTIPSAHHWSPAAQYASPG